MNTGQYRRRQEYEQDPCYADEGLGIQFLTWSPFLLLGKGELGQHGFIFSKVPCILCSLTVVCLVVTNQACFICVLRTQGPQTRLALLRVRIINSGKQGSHPKHCYWTSGIGHKLRGRFTWLYKPCYSV